MIKKKYLEILSLIIEIERKMFFSYQAGSVSVFWGDGSGSETVFNHGGQISIGFFFGSWFKNRDNRGILS